MLVALGFLVAALIAFLIAPAFHKRAVRLTMESLRRSIPLTQSEISADKDRLRAEHAVTVHDLRSNMERATLAAARRSIEINRRDAVISKLEGEIDGLRVSLEEHQNARRVLEQTVTDRLPRVEHRLGEAKRLLDERDREIAKLTDSTQTQLRAMEEASQINMQQRDELLRANAALTTRASRNRDPGGDPRFDAEVALRAELEALRAKTRDQALLINRLQASAARGAERAVETQAATAADQGIERLRDDLAEAEATLRSARNPEMAEAALPSGVEEELRGLKTSQKDQAVEIARLKAALETWERADADDRTLKDSKIALKAKLSSLQAKDVEQAKIIQTLRVENAAANERLARQASYFRDEMRRLGAGTAPLQGGASPRRETPQRPGRTLSERIQERPGDKPPPPRTVAPEPVADDAARASGFLKAFAGGDAPSPAINGAENVAPADAAPKEEPASSPEPAAPRKPRLLDRLTGLDKSSA